MLERSNIDIKTRNELEDYIDKYCHGVYASPITDPEEKSKADRLTREYIKKSKPNKKL